MRRTFIIAAIAAGLCPSALSAQTQNHGSVYETIDRLIGIQSEIEAREAAQRERAKGLVGGDVLALEAAPAAPQALSSFFVTVFPPGPDYRPLSPSESRALALAIGSNALENEASSTIASGHTFLGQFLDHDVTRNEMVAAEKVASAADTYDGPPGTEFLQTARTILINARSSLLDLDSVYGLTIEQIEELVDTLETDALCPVEVGERRSDCFDTTALSETDQRALAAYEVNSEGRLTGRFQIAYRAAGPDGPIVPDLPRCSDVRRYIASPACQANEAQAEGVSHILYRAIIGDGRNDENVVIAQLHLTFLIAHNKLFDAALAELGVDDASATPLQRLSAFRTARQTLIEHWQAIVMDDYLSVHTSEAFVDGLKTGPFRFYTRRPSGRPYCEEDGFAGAMPHEFSVGAFRHGHSQVRPGYQLNATSGAGFRELFGDSRIMADRAVDFRLFFDGVKKFDENAPDGLTAVPSMLIDPVLSPPLAELLAPSVPNLHIGHQRLGDLAGRNLARVGDRFVAQPDGGVGLEPIAVDFGLAVAKAVKDRGAPITLLTDDDVAGLPIAGTSVVAANFPGGLTADRLPLWVYVLAEAMVQTGGETLGDLGAHIIGETLVGLIRCDPEGILAEAETFAPEMVATDGLVEPGSYTMADLINYAYE